MSDRMNIVSDTVWWWSGVKSYINIGLLSIEVVVFINYYLNYAVEFFKMFVEMHSLPTDLVTEYSKIGKNCFYGNL